MTYWQPAYDPTLGLFPDLWFEDNRTLWDQRHEWNMTYSHAPLNLSSGDQTALGSVKGTFRANPKRRPWAVNSTTPDLSFTIAQEFHFAGTRAILRGKYTNATWGNSSQPAMVVYEMNVEKYDIGPDGLQIPIHVLNMTQPFSDGIIWDSGELAFGCHSFTIMMYSGTVEVEGLEVHTGFVSDYDTLDKVPKTTVHAVVNGTRNPFFNIQGGSTIRSEVLGDGSADGSTVQWDSLDINSTMTFQTPPNATYMVVNGTMGPEYAQFSTLMVPIPPGAPPIAYGQDGAYTFSPYRNPGTLYYTPLDPKIQYTVSLVGGIAPLPASSNPNQVSPWPTNIHSVTFWAGTFPPNVTSTGNSTDTPAHGESRASRNGKIIGGAVGGGLGFLLILGLLAWCCIGRRRKPSPVISDPTPFEIDGTRNDGATRVPSDDDDESADKVPEELTPAQVAKAREAGFLGSRGASSSLEPADAVDSRFYYSGGAGSSTGGGSSSAMLSPTSTQVNGVAVKDSGGHDTTAILAAPVHGGKRIQQAEDGGTVDDDGNVVMIPPSYNPSWASRGALADSGAVTRMEGSSGTIAHVAIDHGAAAEEADEAPEAPPPIVAPRASIDSGTFGRAI
ncbi:uncharacterized protein LOC62_01G001750 [Vanrija pseudolonga]|uniref:Uncharacterized protein n=1 Tax=Vanrija pseudolonga TaxID=143232 RepID=A0AAF0Y187_9TREE|nr:hypothetical protein LOC62_01G001750 [Vanrija pseudolonga]